MDQEDDALAAASKYPITLQYKILFQDVSYIFMFISCSQIFGLLGAFGGSIVQEVVIWGLSEDLGSILAASSVIVGLISSIVASLTILKFKNQFLLFEIFQLVSAGGIGIAFLGLYLKNVPILVAGTLIYAIFTFPSFPIMIELIGKRVGKSFDLVATGNVYFLTQVVTAVVLAIAGAMLNDKDKTSSIYSFVMVISLLLLNGIFGAIAHSTYQRPFNNQIVGQTEKNERLADQEH